MKLWKLVFFFFLISSYSALTHQHTPNSSAISPLSRPYSSKTPSSATAVKENFSCWLSFPLCLWNKTNPHAFLAKLFSLSHSGSRWNMMGQVFLPHLKPGKCLA